MEEVELYSIFCYDMYGDCTKFTCTDFDEAIKISLEQFKNVNYQIVRCVSPHQDNDLLFMSKVGY